MIADKILVIGACGQIGTELTLALRKIHGEANVIASDVRSETGLLRGTGPFIPLDVMDKEMLTIQVRRNRITQIYLLSAMLSATGEQHPHRAWQLNMQTLLNTLEVAREENLAKIFWPSSIAVFGPSSVKLNCPQVGLQEPATVYGISKMAGEQWCSYYHERFGIDVRSLRYPGLISHLTDPGGGTTDYAVEIFYDAIRNCYYECFLKKDTVLPMMYMSDAIRGTIDMMEAPAAKISVRSSYNIAGISFSPEQIATEIKKHLPAFSIAYKPDYRQSIAESWPHSIDDSKAQKDWDWRADYDLEKMVADMLEQIGIKKMVNV